LLSLLYDKGTEQIPDNTFFSSGSLLQVCHFSFAEAILSSCAILFAICPWCIKTVWTGNWICDGNEQDSALQAGWYTWLWSCATVQV